MFQIHFLSFLDFFEGGRFGKNGENLELSICTRPQLANLLVSYPKIDENQQVLKMRMEILQFKTIF